MSHQPDTTRVALHGLAPLSGASRKKEREPAPRQKRSSPVQRGRILIVDDEPQFGRTLRMLLGLCHETTYTPSAQEALGWIQEGRRYDAILCDLMMVEMPGQEFYEELCLRAPELARRVIFMSGGAYTAEAREFVARMTNPLLDKPFKSEELDTLLETLLASV